MNIGIGIGIPFLMGGGWTPASLLADASLAHWTASDSPGAITYRTGSEATGRYAVASIANAGTLGGTLAQATAGNQPDVGHTPAGAALFFDYFAAAPSRLASSLAASSYAFMHGSTGTACTVGLVYQPTGLVADAVLWRTNVASASNRGSTLEVLTTGAVRLRVSNTSGTYLVDASSSAGVVTLNTRHIITCTVTASAYSVRVNGVVVLSGAHAGQSAGNPTETLQIPLVHGFYPELVIANRELTAGEITSLESYLSRWSLSVTWAQVLAEPSRYHLTAMFASTGSAWVDLLGNHAVTAVGSPTHGTSADFGGKNAMTLDGSTQYLRYDSMIAAVGSQDSLGVLTLHKQGDTGNRALWSIGDVAAGATWAARYHTATQRVLGRQGGTFFSPTLVAPSTAVSVDVDGIFDNTAIGWAGSTKLYAEATFTDTAHTYAHGITGMLARSALDMKYLGQIAAQLWSPRGFSGGNATLLRLATLGEYS